MKLKEVVEKYGIFYTDFELIQLYFELNNCEEEAVEMLTKLCKNVIKKQRDYNYKIKEYSGYANHIMCNLKVKFEDRLSLLHICQSFINNGKLWKGDLDKAKEIFDKYTNKDFISMPIFFLGYLQSKNVATYLHDCKNDRNPLIESQGKSYELLERKENENAGF